MNRNPDECPKCGGDYREARHPYIAERGRMCRECGWGERINLFMDEKEI